MLEAKTLTISKDIKRSSETSSKAQPRARWWRKRRGVVGELWRGAPSLGRRKHLGVKGEEASSVWPRRRRRKTKNNRFFLEKETNKKTEMFAIRVVYMLHSFLKIEHVVTSHSTFELSAYSNQGIVAYQDWNSQLWAPRNVLPNHQPRMHQRSVDPKRPFRPWRWQWLSSWWLVSNPFKKDAQVKLGSSPSKERGENQKLFELPPPRFLLWYIFIRWKKKKSGF